MAQPREMITRLRLPPLLNSDTHERFSLERHEADATNLLCEQPSIHTYLILCHAHMELITRHGP